MARIIGFSALTPPLRLVFLFAYYSTVYGSLVQNRTSMSLEIFLTILRTLKNLEKSLRTFGNVHV